MDRVGGAGGGTIIGSLIGGIMCGILVSFGSDYVYSKYFPPPTCLFGGTVRSWLTRACLVRQVLRRGGGRGACGGNGGPQPRAQRGGGDGGRRRTVGEAPP